MNKKRILCVVGTRPEAIKMAPVILSLQKQEWADVKVLATAQHRQMLDQVLSVFGIVPDFDLDIMQANQGLTELTARLLPALDRVLEMSSPDMVLAQGGYNNSDDHRIGLFLSKDCLWTCGGRLTNR